MNSRYDKWNGMNGSHTHARFIDLWPDFFLIAVIILILFCVHILSEHLILFFSYLFIFFFHCFSFFLSGCCVRVVLCAQCGFERVKTLAFGAIMSACMAKMISHITELYCSEHSQKNILFLLHAKPIQGKTQQNRNT